MTRIHPVHSQALSWSVVFLGVFSACQPTTKVLQKITKLPMISKQLPARCWRDPGWRRGTGQSKPLVVCLYWVEIQNQPAETCDMCSVQQPKQPMFIWSWWSWLVKNGIPSSWMMIIQKYPKSVVSFYLRTNHQPAGVSWAHALRLRSKYVNWDGTWMECFKGNNTDTPGISWILYYINIK